MKTFLELEQRAFQLNRDNNHSDKSSPRKVYKAEGSLHHDPNERIFMSVWKHLRKNKKSLNFRSAVEQEKALSGASQIPKKSGGNENVMQKIGQKVFKETVEQSFVRKVKEGDFQPKKRDTIIMNEEVRKHR